MLTISVALVACLAAAPEFEAQTLDGQAFAGQISSFDSQQIVLETTSGSKTLQLSALAVLARHGATTRQKASVSVQLIDGSLLAANEYTVQAATAQLTLASGAKLDLPTRVIAWARLAPVVEGELNKQWTDMVETKAAGDLLIVRKAGALDYLEGVHGDIDAQTCKFEVDKEVVPVKRSKVEGVVYVHPHAEELYEPLGQAATNDGSRVAVRSVELAGQELKVSTPAGVSVTVALEEIAKVDFSAGKIAYLSDLQVESAAYTPLFGFKEMPEAIGEFYHFRRDVSFEQNPLRLDGKIYRKGLALASRTALVYKLPGKFRSFKAVVGIDDSVRETGNVHVEIKGDGRVLWQDDVRGIDPPKTLDVDIAGVKRLEIVADYGADLDIGDRLDLCEARVTK